MVKFNFTKNTFVTENERIKVNDSLPLLKDFLLLEDELLQKDLFKNIDSVSAIHYPMHKKKDIVNITPEMLDRYLYDINRLDLKDSIISYDITKKEYEDKKVLVGFNGIDGKEVTISKLKDDINEIRDSKSVFLNN